MMRQSPISYLIHRRRNAQAMRRSIWGLPSSCPCSPWLRQLWNTLDRCTWARPLSCAKYRSHPRKKKEQLCKESGSTAWPTRIKVESVRLNSSSTKRPNSIRNRAAANKLWCVAFAVKQLGRSPICATTSGATSTWSHSNAVPAVAALPSQAIETDTSRKIFALIRIKRRRKSRTNS